MDDKKTDSMVYYTSEKIPDSEQDRFDNWICEMACRIGVSEYNTQYFFFDNTQIEVIFDVI